MAKGNFKSITVSKQNFEFLKEYQTKKKLRSIDQALEFLIAEVQEVS